jgi:hypothetical protein
MQLSLRDLAGPSLTEIKRPLPALCDIIIEGAKRTAEQATFARAGIDGMLKGLRRA